LTVTEKIAHFLDWLEETQHPKKREVIERYEQLKAKSGCQIFPSFFTLLKKLKELNIRFVVLLRTYGRNLQEVAEEIGKHPDGVVFTKYGKFSDGKLHLENSKSLNSTKKIFNTFLHTQNHFAIQDNWPEWNSDDERARSGKPFIFDASGKMHGVKNLSLFFDDNYTAEEKDILTPIEVHGQTVSNTTIQNQLAFRVDPVEAILDNNYYIKLVTHALVQKGYGPLT